MDNFFDIASGVAANYSAGNVLINLAVTFLLVVFISFVYRYTHKGFSYSQNFIMTLIIMSMVTSTIMMVIGNSLAIAFGILGAFSVIRFRTVVKETRDTGFLFLALAVGMAVGTNNHEIALITTIVLTAVIYGLYKVNFGSIHPNDYLLSFVIDSTKNPSESFSGLFEKYLRNSMLLNINSRNGGSLTEMVYSVRFQDESQSGKLSEELSRVPGVEEVHIVSSKSDVEY